MDDPKADDGRALGLTAYDAAVAAAFLSLPIKTTARSHPRFDVCAICQTEVPLLQEPVH